MKQRQYNLDKTAYDLEKENKRFIWKFFTYLYFLLFSLRNFKEIYIMCGIIGFTGNLQAPGILVDGLQQLEYRGYDSAGIAVNNGLETEDRKNNWEKLQHFVRKLKLLLTLLEHAVSDILAGQLMVVLQKLTHILMYLEM